MPRFSLREFRTPDYISAMPERDPNNAIWPRISMLAKALNEMPWFKKGDDTEEDSPESVSASTYENDRTAEQNAQRADDPDGLTLRERGEAESERMKGYTPDGESDGQLHVEDLDRDEVGFDLQNATRNDIIKMQKQLKDGGYNVSVDGLWGPQSRAAYEDYNRKLMGNKLYSQNYGDDSEQAFAKALEEAYDQYRTRGHR